jgi:transglutaminase-like putative cysteine protease
MTTTVKFQDQLRIDIPPNLKTLTVTVPVPADGQWFGCSQTIGAVSVVPSRTPDQTRSQNDSFGNEYDVLLFKNPQPGTIDFKIVIDRAAINVDLTKPLPYCSIDSATIAPDIAQYLKPSDDVQSDDPVIISLAHQLMVGSPDESSIATRIQNYLQQNISYSDGGDGSEDALYVLKRKESLCDGWANLFVALARADGLPARFVGGYSIGGDIQYPVDAHGHSTLTVSSASELHSWVQVWFPAVGWVPFEPQASAGFVDSHHLTVWTGVDSDSVESILSWTSSQPGNTDIPLTETQSPTDPADQVNVAYYDSRPGSPNYTILARRAEAQIASPKL